jgi:hypothetical protein
LQKAYHALRDAFVARDSAGAIKSLELSAYCNGAQRKIPFAVHCSIFLTAKALRKTEQKETGRLN